MELRKVYLHPTLGVLSSPDCAPIGAQLAEAMALDTKAGTFVLHPAFPAPVDVDGAPECETHRRVREAIAKTLPTRGEREAAGMLTDADRAEMATETKEQARAKSAEWEAEKLSRLSPRALAKHQARMKTVDAERAEAKAEVAEARR